jgi:hypothetical protein
MLNITLDVAAKVAILITSYEVEKSKETIVLSHIFYGKTLTEAMGNAKAHLISDYFFSSTIFGEMKWKGDTIYISSEGRVFGVKADMDEIYEQLDNAIDKMKYHKLQAFYK